MSGFVAIYQRNGAPVSWGLLNGLTSFLSFRGPDGKNMWSSGGAGMGHTLLRTTRSSRNERQPFELNGRFWMVGDVRLDRRNELRESLVAGGRDVRRTAFDAELFLHSYALWGAECVRHLRGDFSLAIWDAHERRMFCARDHFGIRPFYYTETEDLFLCSNTLDCVRLHPGVSDELNDTAVADFLLFGINADKSTTTFRDVQRLAPAHTLTVSASERVSGRYWSPPVDGRIRYQRNEEYAEHFREVLHLAVADRLDVDRAGILLSGGMDSGSIAATAKEIASTSAAETNLRAFTVTYERLLGDKEGYFSARTASFLNIPIEMLSMDHLQPFEGDGMEAVFPEPFDDPLAAGIRQQFGAIARHSRVALNGEGIDNLMHFQLSPYLRDLGRRGEWGAYAACAAGYFWRKRSRWHRLASRAKRRLRPPQSPWQVPEWIVPDFARRAGLEERIRTYGMAGILQRHPILPRGHGSLELPQWVRMFETSDAGFTGQCVEARFPFLDLRMVELALALPPYPQLFEKKIERDAMAAKLPASTLSRPKTPLVGDPSELKMRDLGMQDRRPWNLADIAEEFMDAKILREMLAKPYPERGSSCIHALCLNFWLQATRRVRYNLTTEVRNG